MANEEDGEGVSGSNRRAEQTGRYRAGVQGKQAGQGYRKEHKRCKVTETGLKESKANMWSPKTQKVQTKKIQATPQEPMDFN